MTNLLLFGGICALALVQVGLFLFVIRSLRASIYADLSSWFVDHAEGQPTAFGTMINALADRFADSLFQKLKMSSIGQAGGKAPHTGPPGFSTGNAVVDMIISRFAGSPAGAATASRSDDGNHDYGTQLARFK